MIDVNVWSVLAVIVGGASGTSIIGLLVKSWIEARRERPDLLATTTQQRDIYMGLYFDWSQHAHVLESMLLKEGIAVPVPPKMSHELSLGWVRLAPTGEKKDKE